MACLFKRGNGIYTIVSYKRGKRKWKSLRTRDEAEVNATFQEYLAESTHLRSISLALFWLELEPILTSELRETTIDLYRQVKKNFTPFVAQKSLKRISVLDIENYKISRAKVIKKVTVNKEMRMLRSTLNHALRLGYIERNPAQKVALFRIEEKRPKCLTVEQFNKLYSTISDRIMQDIVMFAVMTGLRAGEIFGLEWSDINFQTRQIAVLNKPFHRVKNGKERLVPMNDIALEILRNRNPKSGRVFVDIEAKPISVKSNSDRFRRWRKKAGLPEGINFHSLRHSSLTWMDENRVPPEMMRQIAGHSSIQTTYGYVHADSSHLLAASNLLCDQVRDAWDREVHVKRIGF